MIASAFLIGLAAIGSPAQDNGHLVRQATVSAVSKEGQTWFTVRAENASALKVIREIGRVTNRDVLGLHLLDRPTLVTVELIERPLDQVLEFTLGSIGLRFELHRTSIKLLKGEPESPETQLDSAAAAWTRASMRFPDHPFAAEARLAQGEIAELRGLPTAARATYVALVEDYPNSPVTGDAYMRAGRISAQLGQWDEAGRLYRTLATLDVAGEFHASARLEWARALVAQGDPQGALYMLSALDTNYPAIDATQETARRLVRARALNERGRFMEALEEIDNADKNFDDFGRWEALYIRAVALEGIGLPGDAARAWLLYSNEAKGADLKLALQEAARLALEADDDLAVLFVVRRAELAGLTEGFDAYEREARRRIGFEGESATNTIEERIERAEALIEKGDTTAASGIVEALFLARGALPDEMTDAKVCSLWAQCVDGTSDLEAAIGALSAVRPSFESSTAVQVLDVTAAKLFEKHERFDAAVAAYQGDYSQQ